MNMNNQNKPNIIWFMIDSMRNEFLNEFGSDNERTFLDELIAQGVSFTNCQSMAPFTIVSMGAKLTGCYPATTGLDGWLKKDPMKAIDQNCITMIDILKYNGYYNCLYTDSPYGIYLPGDSFDVYHTQEGCKNFPIDSYINHKGPKFAFVCFDVIHDSCCVNSDHFGSEDFKQNVVATARYVKEYYEKMKTGNDLILITSDHGMRCYDDFKGTKYAGENTTGRYLTEKTTHSSFNIVWKGNVEPQKINNLCRTVDIMPTLINLLGFECPNTNGISLIPLMNGESVNEKYAFSMTGWSVTHPFTAGAWMAKDEQYKLVKYEVKKGFKKDYVYELFDYINDKEEEHNLKDEMPQKFDELKKQMDLCFFTPKSILELYAENSFDYQPILEYRNAHINKDVEAYVDGIIKNVWQKKTRKTFLLRYLKNEIRRIIKYYLMGKYNI